MAEYIDREAVSAMLKGLQARFEAADNADGARACILADIELAQLPAADVVEVVRCKDCVYWEEGDGDGFGVCTGSALTHNSF